MVVTDHPRTENSVPSVRSLAEGLEKLGIIRETRCPSTLVDGENE